MPVCEVESTFGSTLGYLTSHCNGC